MGLSVGLLIWSLWSPNIRKPLPGSRNLHFGQMQLPSIQGVLQTNPTWPPYLTPPLPGLTRDIPALSRLPWRVFYLLVSLYSQFSLQTINIPGPIQFAGIMPTFEFLSTLLFIRHLLFVSFCIFSYYHSIFYVHMGYSTARMFSSRGQVNILSVGIYFFF